MNHDLFKRRAREMIAHEGGVRSQPQTHVGEPRGQMVLRGNQNAIALQYPRGIGVRIPKSKDVQVLHLKWCSGHGPEFVGAAGLA